MLPSDVTHVPQREAAEDHVTLLNALLTASESTAAALANLEAAVKSTHTEVQRTRPATHSTRVFSWQIKQFETKMAQKKTLLNKDIQLGPIPVLGMIRMFTYLTFKDGIVKFRFATRTAATPMSSVVPIGGSMVTLISPSDTFSITKILHSAAWVAGSRACGPSFSVQECRERVAGDGSVTFDVEVRVAHETPKLQMISE